MRSTDHPKHLVSDGRITQRSTVGNRYGRDRADSEYAGRTPEARRRVRTSLTRPPGVRRRDRRTASDLGDGSQSTEPTARVSGNAGPAGRRQPRVPGETTAERVSWWRDTTTDEATSTMNDDRWADYLAEFVGTTHETVATRMVDELDEVGPVDNERRRNDGLNAATAVMSFREDHAKLKLADPDGVEAVTYYHEFQHLAARAMGYDTSGRARSTAQREYRAPGRDTDRETNNVVTVPERAFDDYRLTVAEDVDRPPAFETYVEAVNEAWERLQAVAVDGPDRLDRFVPSPRSPISNYPLVNASETASKFTERFRSTTLDGNGNWIEFPELTRAWSEAFAPSTEMQSVLNYVHAAHPDRSPFDSEPFPETEPDRDAVALWCANLDAAGNPHGIETDYERVLGGTDG